MKSTLYTLFSAPLVLDAHDAVQASNDTPHPFVQESSFLWVTSVTEPGWRLIVDCPSSDVWLVAPEVSDQHKLFDGSLDYEEIKQVSGIQAVISKTEGEVLLKELSAKYENVYALDMHPRESDYNFAVNGAPGRLWEELTNTFSVVKDARPTLQSARAIKSNDEVALMQEAVDVTITGFNAVKQHLSEYGHEYEIEAELSKQFRKAGLEGHAYQPIVATGKNACTLHYIRNQSALPKNGLVLIDAGAKHQGYCADITRTYAIGAPSEREIAVHTAVQKAHHEIIQLLRPGLSVVKYHEQVDHIMKKALRSLGLLKKPSDYRKYFPHAISHGLGIDVHDSLGGPEYLKPGMVLTVEPGIYIPEEGIGVRIEDDILITEDGYRNLSAGLSTDL